MFLISNYLYVTTENLLQTIYDCFKNPKYKNESKL